MGSDRLRQGFTLIELLVVISIIAILASMLLPAITMVRESARKMNCASNLHQMGMAMVAYTNDNDGRLPYYYQTALGVPMRGHEGNILEMLLATYLGSETPKEMDCSGNRIFLCPSSPYRGTAKIWGDSRTIWSSTGGYPFYDYMNAYEGALIWLYYNFEGNHLEARIAQASFHHQSQTPWQFCSNRGGPQSGPVLGYAGLQGSSWHKGFARPTVFLDGHVKVLTSAQYIVGGDNQLYPSTQTLLSAPGMSNWQLTDPASGNSNLGDFWIDEY